MNKSSVIEVNTGNFEAIRPFVLQ